MRTDLSIIDTLNPLKKNAFIIIVCSILGLSIGGIVTFFTLDAKYAAKTQVAVTLSQDSENNIESNNISSDLEMINTYKELVKGDIVVQEVSENLNKEYGLSINEDKLRNEISVSQADDSLLLSITATSLHPYESERVANTTAEVFKEEAKNIMNVDKISIISKARAKISPVFPNHKINLLIGTIIGMSIGIFVSFILELFDRKIRSEDFLSEGLGLANLGNVSTMDIKVSNKKRKYKLFS